LIAGDGPDIIIPYGDSEDEDEIFNNHISIYDNSLTIRVEFDS